MPAVTWDPHLFVRETSVSIIAPIINFTTPRSTLASTFDVQPASHLVDPPRPIVGHRIRLPHLGQQSVAGDLSPPVACLVVRAHQPVPNTPTPRRASYSPTVAIDPSRISSHESRSPATSPRA
ncbi:hypothetical protein BHE74_00040034, partial [Ensete ventricosum]